jgi:hypothetical protein
MQRYSDANGLTPAIRRRFLYESTSKSNLKLLLHANCPNITVPSVSEAGFPKTKIKLGF